MKTHLISLFVLFILTLCTSCGKDDPVDETSDLVFSESPFPLNGVAAKFSKDIAYDIKQRTQFDIWLPDSSTPTGLVIYTHGGRMILLPLKWLIF